MSDLVPAAAQLVAAHRLTPESLAAAFDAFGLDRRARAWPAPWRVDGPGFGVSAPRARAGGNHLSG